MILRTLTVVGALSGAIAFSQFPEYSQQYTQRLAGAVDELSRVVEQFDADAQDLGLSRHEALLDMDRAGGMAEARAESMRRVFARHEKLSIDLIALRPEAPIEMAAQFWRMTDRDVARKAWEDFRPAIPVTVNGIGFGITGFLAGLLVFGALRSVLHRLWPRRGAAT